jgi:HK97 family phage major capsid protein
MARLRAQGETDVYRATRSFAAEYDGETIQITAGRDLISEECELLQRYPDAFEPADGYKRSGIRAIDREGNVHPLYTSDDLKRESDAVEERIRQAAKNPAQRERGASFHEPSQGQSRPDSVREARDAGLRTLERYVDSGELRPDAAEHLDALITRRDPTGLDARYLAAVGDPNYNLAFGKLLADPVQGHLRFSPEEVEAVRAVAAVEAQRALGTTTGAAGAFAIPFTLDPSVILSSNGALNPIREVARTFTIATKEWKGVSSDGVTAAYVAEATEATDASPTLAQPTITTAQGRAFVPFSIEIGMDWGAIQEELVRLISDARDVVDATQFLTGNGSNAPVGLLAIGTTGSLTTSQRVQTDVAATLDIDDVWDLKGNLANSRFFSNSRFAGNPGMLDRIYRFTPAGSTTEPQAMPTRDGALCGRPTIEWSTMVNTTTTGSRVLVVGDFQNYLVADRLGMTVELIPHLFGATNRFPTGQRGLYAYWRTGTVVAVPNAFRYLEVL